MKTKKVQLKNIITEVPEDAVLLNDPIDQLQKGDFVLEIWDNPKWPCQMEINTRLFGQVLNINHENGCLIIGGHFNEAIAYNAGTCTFGVSYPKIQGDAPFPHAMFFLRHGKIWNPGPLPNLYKNPHFDLMH